MSEESDVALGRALWRRGAGVGTPNKRAFGYVRVSSRQQANSGHSLEEQKAAIESYCKENGYDLVEIFVDSAVSAAIPLRKRPAGLRLCCSVHRDDTVVVKSMCRLFRSFADAINTVDQWRRVDGVFIAIVKFSHGMPVNNSTSYGNLIFGLFSLIAEFERELIMERTKDALGKIDMKGVTQIAFPGYQWKVRNGKFVQVPHPESMRQVQEILRMRNEQKMSVEDIYTAVQAKAANKEFRRVVSRRLRRKPGEKGYDPRRVDVWGVWRVDNKFQSWGLTAIKNVIVRAKREEEEAAAGGGPELEPAVAESAEEAGDVGGEYSDDVVV